MKLKSKYSLMMEEMKKIWRPGIVLALVVLGFVYYTMFLEFYVDYFPNGAQNAGILLAGEELVQNYGTSISAEEMSDFEKTLPALHKEADRIVRESELGKKYDLTTYEEYTAFCQEAGREASAQGTSADLNETYADSMRLRSYLQGEETGNIEGRLYGAFWMSKAYRARETYGADLETDDKKTYSNQEAAHIQAAFFGSGQMWQNVLPFEVPQTIGAYTGYLLIFICLSICMLLAPLLVHDRMSRMLPLQYSSKRGRRIYNSQLAAVLLTAFLITTAELAVFGWLLSGHGTAVFYPCRMYSFAVMQFCFPNWTHGTWCMVLAALCYLTAFGTAGIVFFLSGTCGNYIVMLLRVLPVAVVMAVISPKMMGDAFYFENVLYRMSGVPYIEGMFAVVVFVVGMGLCWIGKWKVRIHQYGEGMRDGSGDKA